MDRTEPISIESENVTITKRYEPEEFAVPTISFEIHSKRENSTAIRLEERLPEEFSIEGIGFHPEYDSDRWTAYEDGLLVFEGTVQSETTLVTVYGIRIADEEEAKSFMTEPELTVGEANLVDDPSEERAVIADGAGTENAMTVEHVETAEPDAGAVSATPEEGIAAALAAELRSGNVSAADRATLSEALAASEPESERVQIDHLQARVSELEAYTDAFEEFLDDNGTGEQLVAELQDGVHDLRGDVEAIDSEVSEATARQEATIETLESDFDSLAATVGDRDDIAADIDAVSDDLDALYEQVDELRTWREQMSVAFGNQ